MKYYVYRLKKLEIDIKELFITPKMLSGVIDKVKAYADSCGYNYLDIDGVRVNFPDGWALVRCSNTGPNITARFEGATEERRDELKEEFEGVINEYNK